MMGNRGQLFSIDYIINLNAIFGQYMTNTHSYIALIVVALITRLKAGEKLLIIIATRECRRTRNAFHLLFIRS